MSEINEYPQDAQVKKNHRRLKITIGAVTAVIAVVGLTWGGVAWANGIAAQRAHDQVMADKHLAALAAPHLIDQTAAAAAESDTTTADDVVAAEQAREAQVAAQQLAAEQAAAAAAKAHSSSGGGHPAGTRVPFIPSSDPNNANGGDYEDPGIFCASHSASGNPPVCD